MAGIKGYAGFLISLLVALIILHFSLKVLKKAPVVGAVADKAESLAF